MEKSENTKSLVSDIYILYVLLTRDYAYAEYPRNRETWVYDF